MSTAGAAHRSSLAVSTRLSSSRVHPAVSNAASVRSALGTGTCARGRRPRRTYQRSRPRRPTGDRSAVTDDEDGVRPAGEPSARTEHPVAETLFLEPPPAAGSQSFQISGGHGGHGGDPARRPPRGSRRGSAQSVARLLDDPPRCAPAAAASRRTSSENGRTWVLSRVRTPARCGARPRGTARPEAMSKVSAHQPASSAGVAVGGHGLTGPQHGLGQLRGRPARLRNCSQVAEVAAAVGVAGHARHEPAVLEQEDAGPLHLAELGELAAGVAEQVVHRLRLGGGLDQPEEHLGLRGPALLRPAGPRLGQGDGQLGGAPWRSRCGAAAAAGSTVRTPTPRRPGSAARRARSGCRGSSSSLSAARRPVGVGLHRLPVADDRGRGRVTGRGHGGRAAAGARTAGSPVVATAARNGTTISVVASCTQTETRVAPAAARSRVEQQLQRRLGVVRRRRPRAAGPPRRACGRVLLTRHQDRQAARDA